MQPLVDNTYLLEKFPGKGGWTYARIPEIAQDKSAPFGWVRVKGSIDGYEIKKYHLMPMGNGQLFLPVKAEIRKKTGKQQGDYVRVILYADTDALEVPEELMHCLQDEPPTMHFFHSISENERKYYIDWIYAANKEETRINRIAQTIVRLCARLKMHDKPEE